jgi:F0F1-type ATP synthase assembly protein I
MEEEKTREELKAKATHLKDHVRDYVQTYVQLAKARATRGASTAVSGIVIGVLAFFFAFFFLFFTGFGLGWWVGTLLHNMAAGFFIVSGFFLLLVGLLFALRKKLIVPMIRNMIIKKVYE